ncbi:MAG: hypothetical protein NZZ60_05830 [Bacteroidia bacterium]|nr:hypothetical protein [Bacteroidia bacterium]MCX7652254.1 hypothetical protein [Bacteroidia bacterium]MDW8416516.1 hypothetical protein [Bacteroidia bacterium]
MLIGAGLLLLGKRRSALSTLSPQEVIADAFWRLEAGKSLSAEEIKNAASFVAQVPDTIPEAYALAVAFLLIYGTDALSAPPMVYIQRLQQLKSDPVVLSYLGRLAYHTNQAEKAESYLREAIRMDSTCGVAYLFLSRIRTDSACVWLKRANRAIYKPAEQVFLRELMERLGC